MLDAGFGAAGFTGEVLCGECLTGEAGLGCEPLGCGNGSEVIVCLSTEIAGCSSFVVLASGMGAGFLWREGAFGAGTGEA